jgi:hypothetical protein
VSPRICIQLVLSSLGWGQEGRTYGLVGASSSSDRLGEQSNIDSYRVVYLALAMSPTQESIFSMVSLRLIVVGLVVFWTSAVPAGD